ncbi:armadillo-like helical domain-containing protein 3 [Rhipicephalus microplus]|uniref:Protein ovary overexpressed n=1 Tax=Rhipicephalus microplus TaxID=6941 RepID=A0A6M2CQR6_RHIMP
MIAKQASRQPLKEKFVQIYEGFFKGVDPSVNNQNFWDELFLLKVNVNFIQQQFDNLSGEDLVRLKDTINSLFYHCVQALRSDHRIRVVNALQTLCALIQGVYRKSHGDYGFDIINLLIGFDMAETTMQELIELIRGFLEGDYSHSLKSLVLRFLLVLVTATENVSNNTLLEYVMMNCVFEAILQLLADKHSRAHCGYDAVLVLTILVSYRKYEAANPYIVKLSIVDNELALNGYGMVVSTALAEFNRQFVQEQAEPQAGLLSTVTNFVGTMFLADEATPMKDSGRSDDAVLLALYEAVHLNRNFITILTNSQTESCATATAPTSGAASPTEHSPHDLVPVDVNTMDQPPSNLLVTFLEFCSIVMQKTKVEANANTTKLGFIILTCITEDQYANSMMHDVNMVFKVQLHRMPMRHRKVTPLRDVHSRPLACALLDLMVEFIFSHMKKNLLIDLYQRCLGVIHRLLCYQKKCRVRLQYSWKELWTSLISLLKFLLSRESDFVKKHDIFQLASQVVNIFNLFITYGDTFLPSPGSYDELYYEVIRMHQVFDSMYSMALRYTTGDSQWKDSAAKLSNHLVNVRAIVNHFTPKIDSWSAANHMSALTEKQVLDVVRSNYDTLTLKLHDNLDQYEKYSEKPKESPFFTLMIRNVVSDFRQKLTRSGLGQENVLKEFSTIA